MEVRDGLDGGERLRADDEQRGGRVEVGVAIYGEEDATFEGSNMARMLSGTTVWSAQDGRTLSQRCDVQFVPWACLIEGDRVLWQGGASDAGAVPQTRPAGPAGRRGSPFSTDSARTPGCRADTTWHPDPSWPGCKPRRRAAV